MEKYKFQAKSSDEILSKALTELGVKEEEIVSKMYEEKGGLFSGKKYVLEVVKISEVAEVGKEILSELLDGMSIKANVETKIRNGAIRYEIYSDKSSIIIGKNGHILDAIQTYVRQALFNAIDIFVNVSVDASGYKDKQNYFLEKKVKRIAREVTLSKVDVTLDPMNAYDRRTVHAALQGFKYIKTESEGEEPNRCVVIKYYEGE